MQINNDYSKISFSAMGSHPLRGLFVTSNKFGIPAELSRLIPKTKLNIYSLDKDMNIVTNNFCENIDKDVTWSQDLFSFVGNKLYVNPFSETPKLVDKIASKLSQFFNVTVEKNANHIEGGNFILNETSKGRDLFVGANDFERFEAETLAKSFDADRVISVPQADFHIDCFMFIDGNRAFICDDNTMLDGIKNAIDNMRAQSNKNNQLFQIYIDYLSNLYHQFLAVTKLRYKGRASTDEAIDVLNKAGYETVKIPGRTYYYEHKPYPPGLVPIYKTNYANAILHKLENNDTVLLVGESTHDTNLGLNDTYFGINDTIANQIGFSFRKLFLDIMSKYIKPENIHFIKGTDLTPLYNNSGGIHCHVTEIV